MVKIFRNVNIIIFGFLILSFYFLKGGIDINIIRYPKNTIKYIDLIYEGGVERVVMKNTENELIALKFKPKYTSSLVVKVIPVVGEEVINELDTYFEKGYTGNINISVNDDFKAVIVKEDLTP